jgi:phosphoribosylformimino-5-aminoimidazole carboxamide ribotide isomerase
MEIIPVIDLKGGVVVHASGGSRDGYRPIRTPLSATSDPTDVMAGLLGLFRFRRFYVADLDAIERVGDHTASLRALAAMWPFVEFWVDAGVATLDAAQAWLERGIGCLVLGSESQKDLAAAKTLRDNPRTILSLDFRGDDFLGPPALLEQSELWPARVIVMTLGRVGSSAGPDFLRVAKIRQVASDRQVFAAGGVRDVADLKTVSASGAAGVLVATALHSGAVTGPDLAELHHSFHVEP